MLQLRPYTTKEINIKKKIFSSSHVIKQKETDENFNAIFYGIYPILSFLYVILCLKIEDISHTYFLIKSLKSVCISHQQHISVQTSHILSVSSPPVAGGRRSGGE